MGRYLRPRRTNEDKALEKNIKLLDGEIIMEYPEGRGIGKSPGRIIIGNGNNTYLEKVNATTETSDFQPFITDPSLYSPIFKDSAPKQDYDYDDDDNGTFKINNMKPGIRKLPEIIGLIKETLCEHTDNIKNINDKLRTVSSLNVFDMKIVTVTVTPSAYQSSIQIVAPDEGPDWKFLTWTNFTTENRASTPAYFHDPESPTTFLRSFSGSGYTLQAAVPYKCKCIFVKIK